MQTVITKIHQNRNTTIIQQMLPHFNSTADKRTHKD